MATQGRVTLLDRDGFALTVDPADVTEIGLHAQTREVSPRDGWRRYETTGQGQLVLQLGRHDSARWGKIN